MLARRLIPNIKEHANLEVKHLGFSIYSQLVGLAQNELAIQDHIITYFGNDLQTSYLLWPFRPEVKDKSFAPTFSVESDATGYSYPANSR